MSAKPILQKRLCPNCANSIEEDATKCPYCKAELSADVTPQWLKRDDPSSDSRVGSDSDRKSSIPSKFIWPAAMLMVALIAYLAGSYMQSSRLSISSEVDSKQLQAKDQMIQSQEAQLTQLRQQLSDNSNQLAAMKTKLEESRKEVSAAQQRVNAANREVDRLNASRSAPIRRAASRSPDSFSSYPQPPTRPAAGPGVYETTQPTAVYENPSSGSRIISQIGRGTRINVVSSAGNWLEVRSKHGNPPGYVRADDARPITRIN
ncbi:MAG: SH3 domain-containing protein [Chloroflexota bacterium]